MTNYVQIGKIKVSNLLHEFVNEEALPETGLDQKQFWENFEALVTEFTPRNVALLQKRQNLQDKINEWHKQNKTFDAGTYKAFLQEIGYLEEDVDDFKITTENVDDEIATMAGPQLVVPINNPRYAINA